MVVLEGGGMVTIGNNQYLQPDYLSPLPTTLDAKKSPLALLAQTCSQIGADSSNVKALITMDKNKKTSELSKSPTAIVNHKMEKSTSSSNLIASIQSAPQNEIKLAFKPYETNVLTRHTNDSTKDNNCFNDNMNSEKEVRNSSRVSSRSKTESPLNNISVNGDYDNEKLSHSVGDRKSVSPSNSSQRGASPIIRSGLEILQGHAKDVGMNLYKPNAYGMNPLSSMGFPSGMEQHTNPAFRPPFTGGYTPHHAAMLAAISGYSNSQAPPGTFVSYARVKTPSGGEALVPVCKDPYCTGCQFSAHNQQALMGSPCPSGCTQCEHQKYGFAMAMSGLPPGHPYSQMGRPYICNWIIGESYCGKRYNSSEELLQHLRTHTSGLSDPAAAASALAASSQASLLSPLGHLFSQSALHRAYSNPPLSPLSASRYHPYGKPPSLPPGLSSSAYSGFSPGFSYYSPYALYGQRIGTTAVHP